VTNENRITIRVWGDYVCFTRPEMKVERVSYPIMTPSAARGVLEAIFWEPEMCHLIDQIESARIHDVPSDGSGRVASWPRRRNLERDLLSGLQHEINQFFKFGVRVQKSSLRN
jgi:CRISPR-associated Cas5-like protein